MEYKSSTPQTKAAGEGKATVVIATLGVKDRDGDVLLKGAFGEQVVSVVPAHDWKSPAIGKARIREIGNEAVADIDFYLSTEAGKNWYHAIKEDFERPPPRQQYSWGFHVPPTHTHRGIHQGEEVRFLHASEAGEPLPIAEVSPVLLGAGHNTRSVSVKQQEDAEPEGALLTVEEKQEGMRIQSLVFPKRHWDSAESVRGWLRSHDMQTSLDETESSYRARQREPGDFARLRSFCINPSREASNEECRIMATGGPMKESRGVVEPPAPQASLPPVEDYTGYAEDRRPPLTALINWLRLYRYHMPFLRDVRKRDGKEVSPETISEFKTLVEEMLEVCTLFNIKLMTSALLPNVEEEARLRQQYDARSQELTDLLTSDTAKAERELQAKAEALAQQSEARARAIRAMLRA